MTAAGREGLAGASGLVVAVCSSRAHGVRKYPADVIRLVADLGVEGDVHAGHTVQHASRVARDPNKPNLRQVHLLPWELLASLAEMGWRIDPGDMGENILTGRLDLSGLPRDTILAFEEGPILRITGLRNPCRQLESVATGLLAAVLQRDADGQVVRRCGVMSVVVMGGLIRP